MKFCSHCGAPALDFVSYPYLCTACQRIHYKNPIPVTVVLLPVGDSIMLVRREVPPAAGQLALPGGFVNWGETWQEAGAREVWEETGVKIASDSLILREAVSVNEGVVLLFAMAPKLDSSPIFRPQAGEISEVVLVNQAVTLAFATHTEQLLRYFQEH